jgi:hypothetical protein
MKLHLILRTLAGISSCCYFDLVNRLTGQKHTENGCYNVKNCEDFYRRVSGILELEPDQFSIIGCTSDKRINLENKPIPFQHRYYDTEFEYTRLTDYREVIFAC